MHHLNRTDPKSRFYNEETLAVEAIKEQGAGGSFIAHQHTLDHFRYIWHPRLFDRGNRESWEMAGSHDLGARLNQKGFQLTGKKRYATF